MRIQRMHSMNLDFAVHFLKYAKSLEPPGSCSTYVEHPVPGYRDNLSVPIGIVLEHRFAFAHWIKCKQSLMYKARTAKPSSDEEFVPPDLISFDWHDDFGCDSDFHTSDLETLNQRDENEDRKSTRLNSSHVSESRMPSS